MTAAVEQLAADEPAFLRRNFRVDSEYFDIQPLLPTQAKKKARS
jgi:hypothetical protein